MYFYYFVSFCGLEVISLLITHLQLKFQIPSSLIQLFGLTLLHYLSF